MIENLQKAYELQAQQVDTLARSSEASPTCLLQSARADYMEVLLTRRDSLDAKMELIETKNSQPRRWRAPTRPWGAAGGKGTDIDARQVTVFSRTARRARSRIEA